MARHRHGRSPAWRSTACHQTPRRHSAVLPSASHDQRTPSRTDFIPSWLQHVQTSYYDSSRGVPREPSPAGAPETSWHPNGIPNVRVQSTYDPGRYQSSDLFIRDSPSPAPSAVPAGGHHHHEPGLDSDYDRASVDRRRAYRSKTTVSTPPPVSVVENDVFEKRPRRKTRQDRYNTVKPRDAVPPKKRTTRPSARVSKMGRLRSSREVMANFKSRAITNPNERITLKSTFTPGLFVNGRSSAPLADLVFNEIPLPDEDSEPTERNRSSISRSKKLKEERARREEIDHLTNTLECLREGCPASEDLGSRPISVMSGGDFRSAQRSSTADAIGDEAAAKEAGRMPCHGGLDSGDAPGKRGDGNMLWSLHEGRELQKHSVCSHAAVNELPFLNSNTRGPPSPEDGDSRLEDQEISLEEQPELEPRVSQGELKPCGSQSVTLPDYQDKGVMVSPWMHQRTGIRKPGDPGGGSQPLCPNGGSDSTAGADLHCLNAVPEIPALRTGQGAASPDNKTSGIDIPSIESHLYGYPSYPPMVSANLDSAAEAKDAPYHLSGSSPAWYFGRPSYLYPSLTVDSYSSLTPTFLNDPVSSTSSKTQSRDTRHLGIPPELTGSRQVFSTSQKAHQDVDFLCIDAFQHDEEVPGESLAEYIERMEREILGSDETSSLWEDEGLLPAQPKYRNHIPEVPHTVNAQHRDGSLQEVESERLLPPKGVAQQPVREELGWPSRHYQALPRPESLDGLDDGTGPELASFWRPNHMMWC